MVSPRVQSLNKQDIFADGRYVLYILRSVRCQHSPALSYSAERANANKTQLLVVYFYSPKCHNKAQRVFLLEGLSELKDSLRSWNTSVLCVKAETSTFAQKIAVRLSENASEVVIDAGYLREDRMFEEDLAKILVEKSRRITRIEGNVIVPVKLASTESDTTRSLRPKLWQHVDKMLEDSANWDKISGVEKPCDLKKVLNDDIQELDLKKELNVANNECESESGLIGGEKAAIRLLSNFITNKLKDFDKYWNMSAKNYGSSLSPYLHYGMISPVKIMAEVRNAKVPTDVKNLFYESVLVGREVSHNFVYYDKDDYDTLNCVPEWAAETMRKHEKDKREVIYSVEEMATAKTHDIYWNAAQLEMIHTNKMHNYMRRYWGKKVIEWTPDYSSAYKFLIEQNNEHELDGNDPNSYAGVIWIFGKFDRAHMERPIFGKLRYMNANGLKNKFKAGLDTYVQENYKIAGRELESPSGVPKKKKKKN